MTRNSNGALTYDELVILKRIEEQLTVITKILIAEKLDVIAGDPRLWMLYESAGRIPSKELAKKAHVSLTTISDLWQTWARQGLMIKDGKSYKPLL